MLRETLIDTAMKLGIDNQLRSMRAAIFPAYRHDRIESQYLRSLLSSVLKKDSNCIDIGVFRGRVLQDLVRYAPEGKHIAYEPLPHLYQYLVAHYPTVDVRQAAVSNKEGEQEFSFVKNVPGRSGFREITYPHQPSIQKIMVRVETLDTNLPPGYIPTLIKIDVEGAERQVMEGGIKTISKHKPVIVFEHGKGSAVHYGTRPQHIYELLCEQAGLRIFDFAGNGPYTLSQLEEAFELDEHWDYIAHV